MERFALRSRLRYPLALVGLVFVIAGWLFVNIADGSARLACGSAGRARLAFRSSMELSSPVILEFGAAVFSASFVVVFFILSMDDPALGPLALTSLAGFIWLKRELIARDPSNEAFEPRAVRPDNGAASSRFEPVRHRRTRRSNASELQTGRMIPPDAMQLAARPDPMWDRWLDA